MWGYPLSPTIDLGTYGGESGLGGMNGTSAPANSELARDRLCGDRDGIGGIGMLPGKEYAA